MFYDITFDYILDMITPPKFRNKNLQVIRECRLVLSRIHCINRGGCLVSAYSIFKYFHTYYPELVTNKLVIIQLSNKGENFDIDANKRYIQGIEENARASSHFAISFNNGRTYYDSDGRVKPSRYDLKLVIPYDKVEEFTISALTHGGWNPSFRRKASVDFIQRELKIDLKHLPK